MFKDVYGLSLLLYFTIDKDCQKFIAQSARISKTRGIIIIEHDSLKISYGVLFI